MKRLLVALGALSIVSSNSYAAISVSSATATGGWTAVGSNYDFQADQQTGQAGSDIVGAGGYDAGFFTNWDPGTASNTDGVLGFRVRFDALDHQSGFKGNLWVGIDADVDGDIDVFLGATSSSIGIFDTDPTYANNSPNTTRIAGTATTSYTVSASNYNYRAVNFTNDGGTTNDITVGGTDTDYYLSFTVNFQDVVNFLNTTAGGNISINDSSSIRYVLGTATQGNALNQDLGGVNGGTNSPTTWEILGGFSPVTNATGTVVPEPTAALLGGLGLLALFRRRRN